MITDNQTTQNNSSTDWLTEIENLCKSSKYDQANNLLDQWLNTKDHYQSLVWNCKGCVLFEQDKYKEAIKCFDNALKINPKNAVALRNKGAALYEQNRYPDAIEYLNKALEICPHGILRAEVWYHKGLAYHQQKKYDTAITYYNNSLKNNPKNVNALLDKARTLTKQGNYNEAIKCLDKALEIDPQNIDVLMGKGYTLLMGPGEYDKALEYFDKALEIEPKNKPIWHNKYQLLKDLNKDNEFKACQIAQNAITCLDESFSKIESSNNPKSTFLLTFFRRIINSELILEESWIKESFQVSPSWTCEKIKNLLDISEVSLQLIHDLKFLQWIFTLPQRTVAQQIKYQELCQRIGESLFCAEKFPQALIFFKAANKNNAFVQKFTVSCWGRILKIPVSPEENKTITEFEEGLKPLQRAKLAFMESLSYLDFIKPGCLYNEDALTELFEEASSNKEQTDQALLEHLTIIYNYCTRFLPGEIQLEIKLTDKEFITIKNQLFVNLFNTRILNPDKENQNSSERGNIGNDESVSYSDESISCDSEKEQFDADTSSESDDGDGINWAPIN